MTLRSNARLAGVAFLLYIAAAMSGMILGGRASAGASPAERLASIAVHAGQMRVALLLEMLGCFCALVLAVTLWAVTRDVDPDLALLAAVFRVAEGITGAVTLDAAAERIWLATKGASLDAAARNTLATMKFGVPQAMGIGATCFAVGSTIFAWLLLRGRIVPSVLAWIGLAGSLLAAVVLPLRLVGWLETPLANAIWAPLLVYEVWLATHFLVKGAAPPIGRRPA